MSIAAILAPVFVQVLLTFALLFWTGRSRLAAVRAKEVRVKDIALGQPAWPERIMQVSNTYHNQFETPVLFYTLVAFAIVTRKADLLFVLMAWLFVGARLAHTYVYTTRNYLPLRFRVFLAGTVVLMLMWAIFAVRVLLDP